MLSPNAEPNSSAIVKSHSNANINIIVVDDDSDDAELVCDTIKTQSSKYGLINIQQSKEVLITLDDFNYTELPALIILDYNMPVLTGLELLSLLKTNPRYLHIPVAAYSNSAET